MRREFQLKKWSRAKKEALIARDLQLLKKIEALSSNFIEFFWYTLSMKVLIFGASGSGKTYISSKLRPLGIKAIDADLIDSLSSWYDGSGNKVKYPEDADKEFLDNHEFLWG